MKKQYEAWKDNNSLTFADSNGIKVQKEKKLISEKAQLLHSIEADTWEEALAVHHIKMGWAPYKPSGAAQKCPNNCGSVYYPMGSAECPKCGKL